MNFLKIDRSFVQGLPDVDTARILVNAIMYLAKGFGLEVVAEGVETEAQREFLLEAAVGTPRATCSRRRSSRTRSLGWLSGAESVGQTAELLA